MVILHPVFTIPFIFMIIYGFLEIEEQKKRALIVFALGVILIILAGFRSYVGADYPVYEGLYSSYFQNSIDYSDLLPKMLFEKTDIELEWGYILINKLVYQLTSGAPFFIMTFVLATLSLSLRIVTYYRNSYAPVLSILFYFIPGYFIADCGHMRQALGMAVVFFSFQFIKERNLPLYLLCMYIAFGFHKSSSIFLPAYWFATVRLNSRSIFILVAISVILSPLHIYQSFSSVLDSLSVQEISAGYNGYIGYETEDTGKIKYTDLSVIFFIFLIIRYDKEACEKIPYYEYMRNISVLGVCIYYIMKGNPVFSTRLVGPYFNFFAITIPNILVTIKNFNIRRIIVIFLLVFIGFTYFVFAKYQANPGRFTPNSYRNFLWDK